MLYFGANDFVDNQVRLKAKAIFSGAKCDGAQRWQGDLEFRIDKVELAVKKSVFCPFFLLIFV